MKNKFSFIMAGLGFVFLYFPIAVLIIYSFNKSKLVTVWGGFSTDWYFKLWQDAEIVSAFLVSIKIAAISASSSVVLGVLSAIVLTRFRFKGKKIFSAAISSTLVVPEVVTGFSLLILFSMMSKFIGWPDGYSIVTIILAHVTLGTAYVTLLVQARLAGLNHSLAEAASDLGASPVTIFRRITFPLIMPSVISGWLLSFIISFDDLVIASFTSGPNSTTLPMVVFSRIRRGVSPEINVIATITIVVVVFSALILYFGAPLARNSGGFRKKIK